MAANGKIFPIPENASKVPLVVENKKKLAEILLDPRTIAMADNCPERKEAIATMVRKLQAEREMKRRDRSTTPASDKDGDWTSKLLSTFNCTNIVRMFMTQPSERQTVSTHRKTCRHHLKVHGAGDAPITSTNGHIPISGVEREPNLLNGEANVTILNNLAKDDLQNFTAVEDCSKGGAAEAPAVCDNIDGTHSLKNVNKTLNNEETPISLQKNELIEPSDVLCSFQQKQMNVKGIINANIKVQVNGMDLPPKTYIKKRFEDMAGMILQNASSSDVFFNLLPIEAQNHLRVIHDVEGNDCTNLKTIKANLIPTKSHSAIIILEPAKITEVPVFPLTVGVESFREFVSSSTQTDNSLTICSCSECEMSDESSCQAMDDKHNTCFEVMESRKDVTHMTRVPPFQTYVYSLNKRKSNSKGDTSIYSSRIEFKSSEKQLRSCRSVSDSESDFCISLEDSGARFLSKILRASKPPDKNLISPEVIITSSCRNSCKGDSDEISNGSNERFEGYEISPQVTQQVKKWPRKRMKTSSDSYYVDESNSRLNKPGTVHEMNSFDSDFNENKVYNERPPEISTGYSQLSDKEDDYDNSMANGVVYYINEGDNTETDTLNIEVSYENQKEGLENNNDEAVNQLGINYDGNEESDCSINDSYENTSDISKTDQESIRNHNITFNKPRSPVFPKPFKQDLEIKTGSPQPRGSASAICTNGKKPAQANESSLMKTEGADNVILSDQDAVDNNLHQVEESDSSSEVSQTYLESLKNQISPDHDEISSSEEEQRRQYERNLEMIRMKIRNEESRVSSTSLALTPPFTQRKLKKQNQLYNNKSKEKSKHKHCSVM